MTPAEKAATDRISKARANLVIDHPFFAALALKLKLVPANIGTAGVDGRNLFYDPAWVAEKSDPELRAVVAHEAMHCALGHPFRRGARNKGLWNVAADHVINNILKGAGFTLPKEALCDQRFASVSSEQAYATLYSEQPPPSAGGKGDEQQPGNGQGNDYGGMGECLDGTAEDGTAPSDADMSQMDRDWQVATYQAAQAAKAQGNCPGSIRQLIDDMRAPKVDWRSRLREFVRATAANDYSWRRPNMRHIASGDYFPSLYDETTGPLVIGVDTSGSMSHAELSQICAEINAVLDTVKPERIDVVYCDTAVANAEVFRAEDYPVKMDVRGGGGTSLAPIWPYVASEGLDPVAAILCTDLQLGVKDLGDDPGYPVLVLSTDRDEPHGGPLPFGELVKVEI